MSFLQNARIKTKILAILIPICVVGIGGAAFLSNSFKETDTRYSDFIANDNGGVIAISRANQRLTAMGYNAHQLITYEPGSPMFSTVLGSLQENGARLASRFEEAKTMLPTERASIESFEAKAKQVVDATKTVGDLASTARKADAVSALVDADTIIAGMSEEMRAWMDSRTGALLAASDRLTEETNSTIFTILAALAAVFALAIAAAMIVASRGITLPIERLRERTASLATGETSAPIQGIERRDEVGSMAEAVAVFRDNALERLRLEAEADANRSLSEREQADRERQKAKEAEDTRFAVEGLAGGLEALAEGNVSHRIATPFVAELDVLRTNFNNSASKLSETLRAVGGNARQIDAGANEIRSAADDLSRRTEQQAASVEETAAALEEITTAVKDSARRAEEAGAIVARARTGAEKSGAVVGEAVRAMRLIEKSSGEISSIIGVIDEIAFQTNLLALNAGVEAARAGEAGKGFAVVAQEVRELAQRSAQAAREIKQLIVSSGEQVRMGVDLVVETGSSLETIVREVQEINQHVAAIIEAAREQSTGLQEINTAVNTMDQGTQQNAAMVEQSTAASHGLAREAAALNALLAQFRISGEGDGRSSSAPQAVPSHGAVKPASSPARQLGARLKTAFAGGGNAAAAADWKEF